MTAQLVFELIGWLTVAIVIADLIVLFVYIARMERRLEKRP